VRINDDDDDDDDDDDILISWSAGGRGGDDQEPVRSGPLMYVTATCVELDLTSSQTVDMRRQLRGADVGL